MDGNILATGAFEVMLSKGLGRHFAADEKQQLFQDAKTMADLLIAVMDRKTQELKEGKDVRHRTGLLRLIHSRYNKGLRSSGTHNTHRRHGNGSQRDNG